MFNGLWIGWRSPDAHPDLRYHEGGLLGDHFTGHDHPYGLHQSHRHDGHDDATHVDRRVYHLRHNHLGYLHELREARDDYRNGLVAGDDVHERRRPEDGD